MLPPTLCEAVNPELGIAATPFYVNTEAGPWIARLGSVRRAGIDSFGFGGINVHAIVEEAPAEAKRPERCTPWPAELVVLSARHAGGACSRSSSALAGALGRHEAHAAGRASPRRWRAPTAASRAGSPSWPRTRSRSPRASSRHARAARQAGAALVAAQRRVLRQRARGRQARVPVPGRRLAVHEHARPTSPSASTRCSSGSTSGTRSTTRRAATTAPTSPSPTPARTTRRAASARRAPARHGRRQRGGVRRRHGDAVAAALARRRARRDDGPQLRRVGGAGGLGRACRRRRRSSWRRSCASSTRSTSGCWPRARSPTGALLAVGALPAEAVQAQIAATGSPVVDRDGQLRQPAGAVRRQGRDRRAAGRACRRPARSACRCRSTAAITPPISPTSAPPSSPTTAASSCARRGCRSIPAPRPSLSRDRPAGVRKLAAAQWSQTVRFRETIEQMVADGVGCFVEVGPSGNLTAFVNDIPAGKAQTAIASNLRRRDGVEQLLTVLAQLYASGRPVRLRIAVRRPAHRRRRPERSLSTRVPTACCSTTPCRCFAIRTATVRPCGRVGGAASAARAGRRRVEAERRRRPRARDCAVHRTADAAARAAIRAPASWPSISTSCAASSSSSGRSSSRGRPRSVDTAAPERRPRVADLPFLSEIARAGRAAPRGALPSEPRRQLPAQPRALGPGLRDRCGAFGPGVRAADGQRRDHGRGLQPARRQHVAAGDRERSRLRLDRPRRRASDPRGPCRGRRRRPGASIARRSSTAPSTSSAPTSSSSRLARSAAWRRSAPTRPSVWSGPELYTTGMFHGPVFQSVRQHRRLERAAASTPICSRSRLQDFFDDRRARRGWS